MSKRPAKSSTLATTIRELSDSIVKAQQPIRILDAIKWDASVKDSFFKHKFRKLPPIKHNYYEQNPLGFDPDEKIEEFYRIEHEVKKRLGKFGPASDSMQQRCREYRDVIQLLKARGTRQFSEIAQTLYGSSEDAFYANAPNIKDLSNFVNDVLIHIGTQTLDTKDERKYTATQAVEILSKKLSTYFHKENKVFVKVSDNIVSDASAGADTIKLRGDVKFSDRILRLYEVHEGWVHLGTTINGLEQPYCTFLSKGPPSSTTTQEGLAMLTEIFTFSSFPDRVRRLNNRVVAISMAESGASFIDVFHFFRDQGVSEEESYQNTVRVFRGSLPNLGPFTKDLAYSKGYVLVSNYIRLCIKHGKLSNIPLLFVGKTSLHEIHLLAELAEDDIVKPPKYLPSDFKDLSALSAVMSYSLFINRLDLDKLAKDYKDIL